MDRQDETATREGAVDERGAGEREFSQKLGDVARLWRGLIDRSLRPLGLSFVQWSTLNELSQVEDEVVQKDLAQQVGVEGPTMVGVLDRLVEAGLVERRVAAHDRRANTVHLTAGGRRILRDSETALRALREVLLADLSPTDLATSIAVFDRVVSRAKAL